MGRTPLARCVVSSVVNLRWAVAFGLALALVGTVVPPVTAAPLVVAGGPHTYVEQAAPANIGAGMAVSGGASYDGRYVEFEAGAATAVEHLSMATDATPLVAVGAVSVVGSSVYLGDGAAAAAIGTVDDTFDGQDGRKLRVNFTSPFTNPGFEEGERGWNSLEHWINLGVDSIAGHQTVDTSTYPSDAPNDDDAPVSASWVVETTADGSPTEGATALRLRSSMTTAGSCDVVHGPAVHSSTFEAAAGDTIYFDWRAYAGSDAYHVFGYIVDEHGNQTEVLDTYTTDASGSTNWATKETVIPATGDYRFVFVAGTYDATCGRAAGAQLLIDNVRVYGNKVDDAVIEALGAKLQYANMSDDPPASRTVTVTAQSADSGAATGDITVNITPVDDAPTLGAPSALTFQNTAGDDSFATATGTLVATDPDSDTITYDVDGGSGTDWRTVVGTYATMRVHTSGSYTVEPHNTAIEAQMVAETETFTVAAWADGASDTAALTVQVGIKASPPGAPTIVEAISGDSQATVTWESGSWIGGSSVTDHVVHYSDDGGDTWAVFDDGPDNGLTTTVTGLTPGTAYQFRVAAVNASGTGDLSAPSGPVTPQTTQTPVIVEATDLVYGDAATLAIGGGSGTGEITYTVTDGPCVIDGNMLSTTGVGACTIEATKAGDTTYYPATGDTLITVTPRQLTVTGAKITTRTYDATTTAAITGASLAGVVGDDGITLADHSTATFGQATVGADIPVTTTMTLTGADIANYTLAQPELTGTITRKPLHVTGATVAAKVYDGNTAALITDATLTGVVGHQDVTLTDHTTATFVRTGAGTAVPVTTTMALTGAGVANYVLAQPSLTGTIGAKALSVTDATVTSRVYDGTTAAVITGARLVGIVAGDHVSLVDQARGNFTSGEVGTAIPVTTGMSLVGDHATNYTVLQPALTGTITARAVTVVGATVQPKIADGATTAAITGARLHGPIDGDDVALTNANRGRFLRTALDDDVPVSTRMTLSGDDADQYTLTQPTLTGDIVPAATMSTGTTTDNGPDGTSKAHGSDGDTVQAGDRVLTQLCNLAPGSSVEVTLATGQSLGEYTIDNDGCVTVSAVLPDSIQAGQHTLSFAGTDLSGSPVTFTRDITVAGPDLTGPPPAADQPLPATGTTVSRLVLFALLTLASGAILITMGRRRPGR